MDLIALAKAARMQWRHGVPQPAIYNRLYPKGLVFVHVPKCGGTSVEFALREAYNLNRFRVNSEASAASGKVNCTDENPSVRDILGEGSKIRTNVLQYALGCGYSGITGHAPLSEGLMDAYSSTHAFVTIMRDPIARFKSHYLYSFKSGKHGTIEEEIEPFLETQRARDIGTLFIKYYGVVDFYGEYDLEKGVQNSKSTLEKMSAVGFLDRMDKFSEDISRIRGRPIKIGHENKGGKGAGPDKSIFTPDINAKIEQLCAPDMEIYTWARARFVGS